jgi:acyl carrier protein
VLKIAPARLDARKALGTMGLNSLMAMEMRNRLESELGRSLSATLAWNYPTIDALVAHLSGTAPPPPDSRSAPAAQPAVSALQDRIDEVAKLSDADAARELRGSRRRAST